MAKQPQQPHKLLGRFLKNMRQRLQESLGETSGAVEIAVEQLDRYERGAEVPSEDILMLLINHFNLQEDEAVSVWELAGYDSQSRPFMDDDGRDSNGTGRQQRFDGDFTARQPIHMMLVALDNRVMYSNGAEIVTDNAGVILNFTQADGSGQQPSMVSRIGMSYGQAEQLLDILQRALLHKKYLSGPKQLPPSAGRDDQTGSPRQIK